jgi:ABC-2 type transport system permease protein
MTAAIRAELLQLRTLRSSYIAPVGLLALVALITFASGEDIGNEGTRTIDQLREPLVITVGIFSAVFLAVFAVIRIGGEYRYETIGHRFLAGSRHRAVAAKVVTYAGLGMLAAAAVSGIGLAITEPAVASENLTLDYSGGALAQYFGSVLLGTALFATLGVCAAFICRSQSAGLIVVFGAFIAEKVAALVIGDAAAYLPYGLLQSLLDQGATAPGPAAALLTAMTVAVAIVALTLVRRRDVTE